MLIGLKLELLKDKEIWLTMVIDLFSFGIFFGRTDAEAKTSVVWPPDAKN